jgi:hypothetical protein
VASGDGLNPEQRERIERARRSAEEATGIRFWVRIGAFSGDPRLEAEHLLTNLIDSPRDAGVLVLVGPNERQLEVMTTASAKRRLSDAAVGLAVLTMTSSFGVGDLVGGLVNGLRQMAESAGPPHDIAGHQALERRQSGRAPIAENGAEQSEGQPHSSEHSGDDAHGSERSGHEAHGRQAEAIEQ